MPKTMMSSSDFADNLCFSGHLLLPPKAMPSLKWLKVFDHWSFSSIVDACKLEDEKDGRKEEEGYWEDIFNEIVLKLIKSDLNGGWYREKNVSASFFMDVPFSLKGVNLKAACADSDRFPSYMLSRARMYDEALSPEARPEEPINYIPTTYKNVTAQATLICRDLKSKPGWLYINMSSYDFWDDVVEVIREKYNTINLGGWLFKIGEHDTIDQKFQSIIEAA